jgi:hypothetical protein
MKDKGMDWIHLVQDGNWWWALSGLVSGGEFPHCLSGPLLLRKDSVILAATL